MFRVTHPTLPGTCARLRRWIHNINPTLLTISQSRLLYSSGRDDLFDVHVWLNRLLLSVTILRKSEATTLTQLIDKKDADGIKAHLTNLNNDYHEEGDRRLKEVTIISTFLNKT